MATVKYQSKHLGRPAARPFHPQILLPCQLLLPSVQLCNVLYFEVFVSRKTSSLSSAAIGKKIFDKNENLRCKIKARSAP